MRGKKQYLNKSYFPCKHDLWIGVIIWVSIGLAFYNSYVQDAPGNIKGMIGFIIFFIGWIWLRTVYIVYDELLVTWSGPFRNKVPIKYISSIKPTKNILFSPSFSIKNALCLQVGTKRIVVSPRNKKAFIEALLNNNSKIKVSKDIYKK